MATFTSLGWKNCKSKSSVMSLKYTECILFFKKKTDEGTNVGRRDVLNS